jgi:hypothetical protein
MEDQLSMEEALQKAKPFVLDALQHGHGGYDWSDIVKEVILGNLLLWFGEDSCIITQFVEFPRKKSLHILIGAGDLDELKRMVDSSIVPFAKINGCKDMTLVGRKGWKKVLTDIGFTEDHVTLYRGLE